MDGTKVCRTDTYGAYFYNTAIANPGNAGGTGAWQQIVNSNSIPGVSSTVPFNTTNNTSMGVYEIRIAPSNTSRFYLYFNGFVYRSDNSGTAWTLTGFSEVDADPNDDTVKVFGPYIAVDPVNADVVYVSTPSNGLFVSANAGTSFAAVAAVGTGTDGGSGSGGGHLICFDPSSAVSGGKTQGIYVSTYGTGVYHSTDAGANWTLTTSTPTTHRQMTITAAGILLLVDNSGGNSGGTLINKYTGTWSTLNTGLATGLQTVAVDPNTVTKYIAIDRQGTSAFSSNSGAAWTGNQSPARVATDIPWLQNETLGDTITGRL